MTPTDGVHKLQLRRFILAQQVPGAIQHSGNTLSCFFSVHISRHFKYFFCVFGQNEFPDLRCQRERRMQQKRATARGAAPPTGRLGSWLTFLYSCIGFEQTKNGQIV